MLQKRNMIEFRAKRHCYYKTHKKQINTACKVYYETHKEALKATAKVYRLAHQEEKKIYNKLYQESHKEEYNKRANLRRKTDIGYKLSYYLRCRLRLALKNNQKLGSAVKDLGCSIDFLKQYLEEKFQPGMSWNNYGRWHIDHIKPLSKFDLTCREQFLMATHYTNLQPLWAVENISKRDKLVGN